MSRGTSIAGVAISTPRKADADPDATAWRLWIPGWRPAEYEPSVAATAVAFIAPPDFARNVREAEEPAPPTDTRPRTVMLSRMRVAAMSYDTAVAPEDTWRLPVNVTRTNRWTPEISIVMRVSTVTAKSPSGTWIRYAPADSLSTWNVPPWERSSVTVRGYGGRTPSTRTVPETVFAGVSGIWRSVGPEIVARPADRTVCEPCVRFPYTVYDPSARYVWKWPEAPSATRFSGPSNATGAPMGFPKIVMFPVTRARSPTSTP